MLTINKLILQGRGLAPALLKRAAAVVLDWDTRQKSRFDTEDSQARTLGVFLPRGTAVRGGDVLVAEDGSLVKVIATPQPVMVVRAGAENGSPLDLLRAAYHLGNRHVQLEVQADQLQLEPDHVLAEMLRHMHLIVTEQLAPFEPEGGAYSGGGHGHAHQEHDHGHAHAHPQGQAHDHGHAHPAPGHAHDHDHGHDHGKTQGQGHGHVHGPDCGHDH